MNGLRFFAHFSIAFLFVTLAIGCGAESTDANADNDDWEFQQPENKGKTDPPPPPDPEPALRVSPPHVAFPPAPFDEVQQKSVTIQNVGSAPLEIESIDLTSGSDFFTVLEIIGADDDGSATLDEESDDSLTVTLEFSHWPLEPTSGTLEIVSNDPSLPDRIVELSGNGATPCIDVSTASLIDFGSVSIGHQNSRIVTLRNCSVYADLHIEAIDLVDDGDESFSLVGDDLDMLAPAASAAFFVEYSPDVANSHEGRVDIATNSPADPIRSIRLTGDGVDASCPHVEAQGAAVELGGGPGPFADSVVIEGFRGYGMVNLMAEVVDPAESNKFTYRWSVIEQPDGADIGVDNPNQAEASVRTPLLGIYVLEVEVQDEDGVVNCEPATVEIETTTDADVYLELSWTTPAVEAVGGVNSSDRHGTDLDLHYVRPDGSWGDPFNSIYWDYPQQDWNGDGRVNAEMTIDDMWGIGPEIIIHDDPEDGRHDAGVHVYRDNCWGPIQARVRVALQGQLVAEHTRKLEQTDNFWHAGAVHWSEDPHFEFVDAFAETFSLTSFQDLPIASPESC